MVGEVNWWFWRVIQIIQFMTNPKNRPTNPKNRPKFKKSQRDRTLLHDYQKDKNGNKQIDQTFRKSTSKFHTWLMKSMWFENLKEIRCLPLSGRFLVQQKRCSSTSGTKHPSSNEVYFEITSSTAQGGGGSFKIGKL